jgi:hypothetical protein
MRRYLATFLDLLSVAAAVGTLPICGNAIVVAELAGIGGRGVRAS